MRLYFIRHGQSANNARPTQDTPRQHDPALTAIGVQQAEIVAAHLAEKREFKASSWSVDEEISGYGITRIIASPMWRAMQTAQIIGQALNIAPEVWDDVHEHGGLYLEEQGKFVSYPGAKRSEIAATFPNFKLPDSCGEDGWWNRDFETWDACHLRASTVADRLRTMAASEERIALVSHQSFFGAVLHRLFSMPPYGPTYFNHFNAAIASLDFAPNGVLFVRYLNRIEHLPPELVTT